MSDAPMRHHIAVDARVLRPPLSGVGRYALTLLRALARRAGPPLVTAFIDDRATWGNFDWPEGFRAVDSGADLESHPLGDLAYHWRLPKKVAALDPAPTLFLGPAFQVPWKRRFAAPRVVVVHDVAAFLHPDTMPAKFAFYLRAVVRRSVAAADRVVAVSEATRRGLIDALGVAPEKIVVIGEGPLLDPAIEEHPHPEGPREGVPFWLFVGAMEPRKNIPFLLDAFDAARDRGDRRKLVLCGPPGWKNRPILDRVAASAARGGIVKLPYVSDAELAWLYRHADALLFPSLYEGFGLPPVEAAAFGSPSLVSDRGALPEVALSPEWVLPLERDAWVERMLAFEPPPKEALRARAARFSWDDAAEKLLVLADELAGERNR